MPKRLAVVILAAGKGTRMGSDLPKALHTICGVPMLGFLIQNARALGPRKVVVVAGRGIEKVKAFVGRGAAVVRQEKQLGSGHAVYRTAPLLERFDGSILVLYCDTPLISPRTLRRLWRSHRVASRDGTLLSVNSSDPSGYGRVKRSPDRSVAGVIEESDLSGREKAIREINVGCYLFESSRLFEVLRQVSKNPRKKEYYLTDAVAILSRSGRVGALKTADEEETLGVNTPRELERLQNIMQKRILDEWIKKGVRIRDPRNTTIDAGVRIGNGTEILPYTVIERGCVIGRRCTIGPFARIRGASRIGDGAVIGNFVEVVRSTVGPKTQIKHLSYIGDAAIGSSVNIGAGAITANYDGKAKRRTVIKDRAQIGSGTVLIAPVTVGRAARTGAGAVVTKRRNVPDRGIVVGVPARRLSLRGGTK